MVQQQQQPITKQDKEATAPKWTKLRQANLGDRVAWKEELASQEQFGFSIYGHTADDFGCCCTSNKSSTNQPVVTPTVPTGFNAIQGVSEIVGKVDSAAARDLLVRIARDFEPVVSARGWTVRNLVELCTCNDTKPANVP